MHVQEAQGVLGLSRNNLSMAVSTIPDSGAPGPAGLPLKLHAIVPLRYPVGSAAVQAVTETSLLLDTQLLNRKRRQDSERR